MKNKILLLRSLLSIAISIFIFIEVWLKVYLYFSTIDYLLCAYAVVTIIGICMQLFFVKNPQAFSWKHLLIEFCLGMFLGAATAFAVTITMPLILWLYPSLLITWLFVTGIYSAYIAFKAPKSSLNHFCFGAIGLVGIFFAISLVEKTEYMQDKITQDSLMYEVEGHGHGNWPEGRSNKQP